MDRLGEALSDHSLGSALILLGQDEGRTHLERALDLHAELGNHHQALACCERSLARFRDVTHQAGKRPPWTASGTCSTGRAISSEPPSTTSAAWHEALAIFTGYGHSSTENVRAKLAGLPGG